LEHGGIKRLAGDGPHDACAKSPPIAAGWFGAGPVQVKDPYEDGVLLLDPDVPDESLRKKVFAKIPRAALENALERVSVLIRPPDDVYYQELSEH
jgi:hypothetical protein